MKYLRKIGVSLVIFAFIFQSISMPIYAMSSEEQILTEDLEMATILLDEDEESVPLYEEDSETSEILVLLESDEEVIVLDKLDDFSFVEYIEKSDEEEVFQGFVLNDFLNFNEEDDLDEDTFDEVEDLENENDSDTNESEVENAEDPKILPKDEPADEVEDDKGIEVEEEELEEVDIEEKEATSNENTEEVIVEKHQTFSVQSASLSDETFIGIALKDKTHVYASQSTSSTKLRSYEQGSTLKYRSLNANWYEATVMYNGKWTKGYIHKNDVENIIDSQAVLQGVALQNPTKVYGRASTGANTLRTYAQGSILKYKTLTSNWYEATVMYNGKWTTGYIHKNDIENSITDQARLQGIGTQNPTTVFASASTGSKKLKSYAQGSILTYRTFSSNWYQATVYINGKATTGYIHKSHVDNIVDKQETINGIGLGNPTTVYARASTGSNKLKSYAQGTILKYKTFSSGWYEATVYINGKAVTGYIYNSDVEELFGLSQSLDGMSLKSPTNVYSRASKNASVLRSYSKNHYLLFRTFSPNWYEATVILNGVRTTGYIHRNDVSTDRVSIKTTSYATNFNRVVDIQMNGSPQVSGSNGGWVNASRKQVEYYVNSSNFSINSTDYYQFLVLSQHANLNVNEVNQKILNNHGILTGKARAFIDAGKKHNVNEAYLISHALLETGNGKSALAQGVPVDNKGNVVASTRATHTVYNMYGIGAVDSCPLTCGAKRAFDEGWFTPEDAIIGGAEFINSYITRGQDTLYKMRWNPISPGYPQYATDIAWATKQTTNISRIYSLLDRYVLIYDVPKYAGQPTSSGSPSGNAVIKKTYLKVTATSINVRTDAGTSHDRIGGATNGQQLVPVLDSKGNLIKKTVGNHVWYQIEFNNSTAWVSGGINGTEYIEVLK